MELRQIKTYLSYVASHHTPNYPSKHEKVKQQLKELKVRAVQAGDQRNAKEIWCFEQILTIQGNYVSAFSGLKDGKYYDAWCLFERVEIGLHHLERHFSIESNSFQLEFIGKHTRQFQSLYPYSMFLSPGYLILEAECSICNQPISIRNPCHTLGEIYNGEMCCREITNAKLLEASLVEKPAQKYSVLFSTDPKTGERIDHYNYTFVKYVAESLKNPFDEWDIEWTKKRHPHSRYKHTNRNDKCPCESGKKYKACCLNEIGVLRPHLQVRLSIPPSNDTPTIIYTD